MQRRRCEPSVVIRGESDVSKDPRGQRGVHLCGIICVLDVSQECQRGVVKLEFGGGRAKEGCRMNVGLEFSSPFGEGDEREAELPTDEAEEGEGGDGGGVCDVEIC